MMHTSQTLTQAIQDAPQYMHEIVARHNYWLYCQSVHQHDSECYKFEGHDPIGAMPFHEWLTVNRVRIL